MQVAGIVGRAELMSALCFFLTMLCYARTCDEDSNWFKVACWLILTIILVGCALLFKEQGITAVVYGQQNFYNAYFTPSYIMQGVCIIYDILLHVRADLLDFLRLKVSMILS